MYPRTLKNLLAMISCTLVVIFNVFLNDKVFVEAMYMPTVLWDPRNSIFNCPSRGINTIQVRMKDYMNFQCPSSTSNLVMRNSQLNYFEFYEVAYFVYEQNKKDVLNCNVTGYTPFLKCDKPQTAHGMGIRIASFSGNDNAPLFHYGKTYYLIGTGTGLKSGINNQVGGRCSKQESVPEQTHKMILKIKVCSWKEEFVYKNCTVCKTVGCYNKGCGIYNDWKDWEYFQNISLISTKIGNSVDTNSIRNYSEVTNCFRKRSRTCKDEVHGCDGPSEQTEHIACPKANLFPTYDNCTEWVNVPSVDSKATGFVRKHRNCTIGFIERMTISQLKIVNSGAKPMSAALKGLQNGNITVSIQVFIVCLIAPVIALAIGVVIGYFCTRRSRKKKGAAYIQADMPRQKNSYC